MLCKIPLLGVHDHNHLVKCVTFSLRAVLSGVWPDMLQ